jgi:hypothetical protein
VDYLLKDSSLSPELRGRFLVVGDLRRFAREDLGLDVQERPIGIEEVLSEAAEAFCTGTAWTLKSVGGIAFRDQSVTIPGREVRDRLWEIIGGIQTGRLEDHRGWTRLVPEGASGL